MKFHQSGAAEFEARQKESQHRDPTHLRCEICGDQNINVTNRVIEGTSVNVCLHCLGKAVAWVKNRQQFVAQVAGTDDCGPEATRRRQHNRTVAVIGELKDILKNFRDLKVLPDRHPFDKFGSMWPIHSFVPGQAPGQAPIQVQMRMDKNRKQTPEVHIRDFVPSVGYEKYGWFPFNDQHPELRPGEVFLTNGIPGEDLTAKYVHCKTLRRGTVAYAENGEVLPFGVPWFISRAEHEIFFQIGR